MALVQQTQESTFPRSLFDLWREFRQLVHEEHYRKLMGAVAFQWAD